MEYIPYIKFEFVAQGSINYAVACNTLQKELSYQEYDKKFNMIKNYGIHLKDNDMQELSEYINALEFEAYRNKNADDSKYIIGYRDEYSIYFRGVTDSQMPLIQLSVADIYKNGYEPPQHKLYDYILHKYFLDKKYKKTMIYQLGY